MSTKHFWAISLRNVKITSYLNLLPFRTSNSFYRRSLESAKSVWRNWRPNSSTTTNKLKKISMQLWNHRPKTLKIKWKEYLGNSIRECRRNTMNVLIWWINHRKNMNRLCYISKKRLRKMAVTSLPIKYTTSGPTISKKQESNWLENRWNRRKQLNRRNSSIRRVKVVRMWK